MVHRNPRILAVHPTSPRTAAAPVGDVADAKHGEEKNSESGGEEPAEMIDFNPVPWEMTLGAVRCPN